MKHLVYWAAVAAMVLGCVSCAKNADIPDDETTDEEEEFLQPSEDGKIQLSSKASEMVKLGNSFAVDFIDRVNAQTEGSYIISPLSMQFLLGMILNGAQGTTADEICQVLGYGAGEVDDVNQFCLSMLKQLPVLDQSTKLSIANAVVVNQNYPLKDSYKETVGKFYEAEVSNMDFTDNDGTTKKINQWCSDHTNGLIPEVLKGVDPQAFAYLMNALYFKSSWSNKFNAQDTAPGDFAKEDGEKTTVQMMKMNKKLTYSQTDVYSSVDLPYGNGAYVMTVFLPAQGKTLSDVTSYIAQVGLDKLKYSNTCTVDLMLPKFETDFDINLNDILIAMGMPSAFYPDRADLKGMSERSDLGLFLSSVKQFAKITVDEEGSEAAAVSIGVTLTSSVPNSATFHADRPFLYLIRERSTRTVLFAGRYSGE